MNKKFLLVAIGMILCTSCGPKETKYDKLEISKIESIWREGFGLLPCDFTRTVDFENNTVFDTKVGNLEYVKLDQMVENGSLTEEEKNTYNNPKTVTTFEDEQEEKFIKKIKSLGIYTWKDRYVTDHGVSDGGNETLKIYFTDGTVKTTYFYFKYPSTYDKVCEAFVANFGVGMYLRW